MIFIFLSGVLVNFSELLTLMIGVIAGVQEIHSGVVASTFPITMEELIEFRRDYVGTPEDAIREIIYRYVGAGPRAWSHEGDGF